MSWECYLKPVKLPFELPTSVYGAMLVIWQLRPNLQRRFPLHKMRRHDYVCFLAWCAYHGRREYVILRELVAWDEELRRSVLVGTSACKCVLDGSTSFLVLAGIARNRYNIHAVLTNDRVQRSVLKWFDQADCQEFVLSDSFEYAKGGQLSPQSYGWFVDTHRFSFVRTAARSYRSLIGLMPAQVHRISNRLRVKINPLPSLAKVLSVVGLIRYDRRQYTPAYNSEGYGVNLFGYAKGELGIGEDLRMVARALECAAVPFCIINVQPGADVSQMDESMAVYLVDKPRYTFNLFCMTGIEHARFVVENGVGSLLGRYTVGLWPWELPEWPKSWFHSFELVDEVWGISKYTARSYKGSGVLTKVMPLPVDLGVISSLGRAHFGLPDSVYLYYFSFDYNSTLSRKNPEAVISAFTLAYPKSSNEKVGLVLKVSHTKPHHKRWQRLLRVVDADSRIILINESFRRPDLLALYSCCDCLVSLHRAEGFGRAIVEAILLGKQVVTTGFSGNVDFCDPRRVFLVDFIMKPINKKHYFYAEGQFWAEPSLQSAALKMQEALQGAHEASPECVEAYGLRRAGDVYKKRLLAVHSERVDSKC